MPLRTRWETRANTVSAFSTPGPGWPCHTALGRVGLRGARAGSTCQRRRSPRGREPRGDRGDGPGPDAWRAEAGAHLSGASSLWQGRQGLPGAPRGRGLRVHPAHPWGLGPERWEPAQSWAAFDRQRPPHTRPDTGPPRCARPQLPCPHTPHGVPAGLDAQGERSIRPHAPIGHAHLPWWEGRMDRRRQSVGEKGRAPGTPPPGRGSVGGPKASGKAGGSGREPPAPSTTHGRWPCPWPSSPAEGKAAQRAPGAGVPGGRRPAPHTRQRGPLAAGGVAMATLSQEERQRAARRAPASAPGGLPALTAPRQHGGGVPQQGPRACDAWQNRGEMRNHRLTSGTISLGRPIQTDDAWRLPTSARSQAITHAFCLTSCHSALAHVW